MDMVKSEPSRRGLVLRIYSLDDSRRKALTIWAMVKNVLVVRYPLLLGLPSLGKSKKSFQCTVFPRWATAQLASWNPPPLPAPAISPS